MFRRSSRPLGRTVDGIRVTAPKLTAHDLAPNRSRCRDRTRPTRTRPLPPDKLDDALTQTSRRRNNEPRRRWLNNPGEVRYAVDVVFRDAKVAIEVDGYEFHRSGKQFHRDPRKWTDLAAAGWAVLHFTWPHLTEDPEWSSDPSAARSPGAD